VAAHTNGKVIAKLRNGLWQNGEGIFELTSGKRFGGKGEACKSSSHLFKAVLNEETGRGGEGSIWGLWLFRRGVGGESAYNHSTIGLRKLRVRPHLHWAKGYQNGFKQGLAPERKVMGRLYDSGKGGKGRDRSWSEAAKNQAGVSFLTPVSWSGGRKSDKMTE